MSEENKKVDFEIPEDEKEIYKKLTNRFPIEAYKVDKSRGFDLTSLDAQYIKDRLNEVFGMFNWEFKERFIEEEKEIEVEEMLPKLDANGKPIYKNGKAVKELQKITILRKGVLCNGILTVFHPTDRHKNRHIQATGGCSFKSKGQTISDAYKSAATESLSKACSYIGIGGEMYKGLVDPKYICKDRGNFEAAIKAAKAAKTPEEKKKLLAKMDLYKWSDNEIAELKKELS